jgi:hypothetical protein
MQTATDRRAGLWTTPGLWTSRRDAPLVAPSAHRERLVRPHDVAAEWEQ